MVTSVEMRGRYKRRIWTGPEDQLVGLQRISRTAGEALVAFCLMSTHLHLVLDCPEPARIVRRIQLRLDKSAEERNVAKLDEPHMEVLSDDHAVLRYVAYAHANPVAAEMVADPLAWPFSSHRDVLGFRRARWFSPSAVLSRGASWINKRAGGQALPESVEAQPRVWPTEPLDLLQRATASVFGLTNAQWRRHKVGAEARRTFTVAAELSGWRRAEIAAFLGWTERHGRRVPLELTPAVSATLAVVTDIRLRPSRNDWWFVPADARGPNLWIEWRDDVRLGGQNGGPVSSPAP